jgi:hypothetical protein
MFPEHHKYFETPIRLRKSKASESFGCSIPEHAAEVVSSRKKKSLTPAPASTGAMLASGVTFREHQRPVARSK